MAVIDLARLVMHRGSLKQLSDAKIGCVLKPGQRRLLGAAFVWVNAARKHPIVSKESWQLLYRGQRPVTNNDRLVFHLLLAASSKDIKLVPSITPVEEDIWL